MNVFNRIVVLLLLLALLALALVVAVFPFETFRAVQTAMTVSIAWLTQLQASLPWLFVVGRVVLVLLAVLIFAGLVWGELKPRRPKAVQIHTESGSKAAVTTDSVARRLQWHIDQLADVISVTPLVTARGRSVDVRLDLETTPEIDVPMKTEEVVSVAREVITERMGLQLGRIEVNMKHAPYQDGTLP